MEVSPPASPRAICATEPQSPVAQPQLHCGFPQTPVQQPLLQPQQPPLSSPASQFQYGAQPPPMSPFPSMQQPRILQTPTQSSQRNNAHTQARMMR
jgi:hypothetical protein